MSFIKSGLDNSNPKVLPCEFNVQNTDTWLAVGVTNLSAHDDFLDKV
jgi:hypothetical protein